MNFQHKDWSLQLHNAIIWLSLDTHWNIVASRKSNISGDPGHKATNQIKPKSNALQSTFTHRPFITDSYFTDVHHSSAKLSPVFSPILAFRTDFHSGIKFPSIFLKIFFLVAIWSSTPVFSSSFLSRQRFKSPPIGTRVVASLVFFLNVGGVEQIYHFRAKQAHRWQCRKHYSTYVDSLIHCFSLLFLFKYSKNVRKLTKVKTIKKFSRNLQNFPAWELQRKNRTIYDLYFFTLLVVFDFPLIWRWVVCLS